MKYKPLLWLPFILGFALLGTFYKGLKHPDDHIIASKMIGQPLPQFSATPAMPGQAGAATTDFADGKPRLLNIFASWCVPCAAESPQLMALKQAGVPIDGIAIRDAREDVDRFLARYGNPYDHIGLDARSSVQLALGSSGVPETFLIDGQGKIVHQHIGDIGPDDIADILDRWKAAQ